MATRVIRWLDNGIGLWREAGGDLGIFEQTNGLFRLQRKTGPECWQWVVVSYHRSFDEASKAARTVAR